MSFCRTVKHNKNRLMMKGYRPDPDSVGDQAR